MSRVSSSFGGRIRQRGRSSRVIALATGAVVATCVFAAPAAHAFVTFPGYVVDVGHSPAGIAVDPVTHQVFVANDGDGTVTGINERSNVTVTIPVGSSSLGVSGVAVDVTTTNLVHQAVGALSSAIVVPPVGSQVSTVYIGCLGGGVVIINPATDAVTGTISLAAGETAGPIAIDESTHAIYTVDGGEGKVVVISGATHTVTTTVTVGGDPTSIAVDSGTHQVYVGDISGKVSVINGTTDAVTATLAVPYATELAVDPGLHTVYATQENSDVVNAITESSGAVKPITVGKGGALGIAVDTALHELYVTNRSDNTMSVVNGTTGVTIGTLSLYNLVGDVAVDSATHTAYPTMGNATVGVVTRTVKPPTVTRFSGADRYRTAVAVSQYEFPAIGSAGAVVLARGDDYPDALVGVPLAKANNAPLLLTSGPTMTVVSLAEILRVLLPGKTVYVLGGSAAIPTTVDTQLTGLGYQVVRYSGSSRYDTAIAVAASLGNPSTVLLATGINFPDALSAGVAAANVGGVVLLTDGSTLPTQTAAYLTAHAMTTYAIGGPAATADPTATALVGTDRYQTAVDVAQRFFAQPTAVGIATGLAFPDALSGGVALGRVGAPLVLVAGSSLPSSASSYLTSIDADTTNGLLFGGPNTVAATVQTAVQNALIG